jgi:cation diffusion facilitator family transporter
MGIGHGHDHDHDHTHGGVDPALRDSRAGMRALLISLIILGITAAIQAVLVVFTGSVALLADTVHNVGDAFTAIPLGAAFLLGRKPATDRFPYGLHRTEDLAGLAIIAIIFFSGAYAIYEAITRFINPQDPSTLKQGGNLRLALSALPSNFNTLNIDGNEADTASLLRPTMPRAFVIAPDGSMKVNTDALDALYKRVKPKGVTMSALLAKAVGNAVNETVVYAFMALFVVNVVVTAIGIRLTTG